MSQRINVYVYQHKEYPKLITDCVTNMQVGKAIAKKDLELIGDDSGDSISEKNPNFCELTALYWIWKNSKDDVVGLMHYRRFFNFGRTRLCCLPKNHPEKCNVNSKTLDRIFSEYDAVLPKKAMLFPNVRKQYSNYHYSEDLDLCLKIISDKFSDFLPSANKIMSGKSVHLYNMLIAKKDVFDEYCSFLFTILFSIEKEIAEELANRDKYNQRVYGFLSERLLNIFFDFKQTKAGLRIKEAPVTMFFPDGLKGFFDFKMHGPAKRKK